MIKNITASNFRSFRHLNADLASITLFVGPNNSGKSSAVSVIRLLSQTAESNDPNVRLLLDGALGDFGTYKDLVHGNETRRHLEISFTLEVDENTVMQGNKEIRFQLHYKYRSSLKETILKKIDCYGDKLHQLSAEYNEDSERFSIKRLDNTPVPPALLSSGSFRGFDVRNFMPRQMFMTTAETDDPWAKQAIAKTRIVSRNAAMVSRSFHAIEYVGAMRVPPTRTYLYTGERRQKVGANGEHAITMLAMDSMRRGKNHGEFGKALQSG